MIRRHNPNRKIYGLFGGEPGEAEKYRGLLGGLLDDFWVYPGTYGTDSHTKWIHGDLLLLDWYDKRGRDLVWDSIAITQWDMVLLADIQTIVPGLQKDQVYFSGYRVLDEAVENRWAWTKPDSKHRNDFLEFGKFVSQAYGYDDRLKCCLYIFEVLTRAFFDGYLSIADKKLGMLEYKDPTLAKIFGLDIYEQDVGVFWKDQRQSLATSPLNAMSTEISESYMKDELKKSDGWRLFHPYQKSWRL